MIDWTNPADYEYLNGLTPAGWAFEFLRRNPEYRQDYQWATTVREDLHATWGPYSSAAKKWRADDRGYKHARGVPLRLWFGGPRTAEGGSRKVWFERYIRQRWGMRGLPSAPDQPANPAPKFDPLLGFPIFPSWSELDEFFHYGQDRLAASEGSTSPSAENFDTQVTMSELPNPLSGESRTMVAVFHLDSPLDGQIENLTREFRRQSRSAKTARRVVGRKPRYGKTLLSRYLRMIDGNDVGASLAELATLHETYSEPKDATTRAYYHGYARDSLVAASEYVSYRYRSLASLKKIEDESDPS